VPQLNIPPTGLLTPKAAAAAAARSHLLLAAASTNSILGGGVLEGAVYREHSGAREFLRVQRDAWASVAATPIETRTRGDLVLVEVQLDAVGRTSGVSVERTTWNVFEVRDGEIKAGRVYMTKDEAIAAFDRG
jgi:ketosteroid isomerase-like protein